ncbi:alpha/beta hydrolase-fold protein [Rhizosphaericola mali]|uniref:alpha/beta hydrolase-fold protein n=1 Tax=Rhizosphaericola mali TaxID=2545455 RepID=UPI001CD9C76F|nr:alpha/beta hydrolase-fold protein [Rhizosphaericola mali]
MTDLQKLADQYEMIIVTPDGFDSFYTNSVSNKKMQWESFFFQDLVPKIHELFSINNKNIFITGSSSGGYGALRLFFISRLFQHSSINEWCVRTRL